MCVYWTETCPNVKGFKNHTEQKEKTAQVNISLYTLIQCPCINVFVSLMRTSKWEPFAVYFQYSSRFEILLYEHFIFRDITSLTYKKQTQDSFQLFWPWLRFATAMLYHLNHRNTSTCYSFTSVVSITPVWPRSSPQKKITISVPMSRNSSTSSRRLIFSTARLIFYRLTHVSWVMISLQNLLWSC